MISTENELLIFCNQLRDDLMSASEIDSFLTVDTEFIMDSATAPLLCSIQIASPNRAEIIDALEIKDKSALSNIIGDSGILKVFHGCDQDIDLLTKNGVQLSNIYDTQLAEMAISADKIASYETLVLKYLKRSIRKTYKISDWKKRPLSVEQERYALNDVIYLRDVFTRQYAILNDLNRVNWVTEEMQYKLAAYNNADENDVLAAFSKQIYTLDTEAIEVLKELALWRRQLAQQEGAPDYSVIKNDLLVSVAKGGMNRIRQIQKSRFCKDKIMRDFVNAASKICKSHKIVQKNSKKDNAPVADFLKIILDYCSQQFSVNKNFIADTEDIIAIANDIPQVCDRFSHGWRYDIFGKYIQLAKSGKILVLIDNNKLQMIEKNE